jgi:3-dehydroquinate dehydratase-2
VRIAVLNGPNLNLLGTREPAVYGSTTLADIERGMRALARELGVELSFSQHNGEGELIDAIHALRGRTAGVIVNAGAYSHSSLAIRDALVGVELPFVEVHVTNVYAREPERRHSMLASAARAVLCGFGPVGYELALRGLVASLAVSAPAGGAPGAGPSAAGPSAAASGTTATTRRARRG